MPRRAVALVARARYNEPYVRLPMRSEIRPSGPDRLRLRHVFGTGGSSVTAEVDARGLTPPADSEDRWLTHQELGFGRSHLGRSRRYRVEHPVWPLHRVHALELDVDFAGLYGPDWAFLADAEPGHVTFATGSDVALYPPGPTVS